VKAQARGASFAASSFAFAFEPVRAYGLYSMGVGSNIHNEGERI
jgi:hypothetical protein